MIAKFQTYQDAKDYADQVHAHLQTFPNYIAEKWAEVSEHFEVPIFADLLPITEYETLTEIIHDENEYN